jgi:predicted nucleotidyltransferase
MMSQEDQKIFKEFKARIKERYSEARIWAFGSRARGDATWDSDFDVFIVLNKVDQKADRYIRDIAWEVSFNNERVITTILIDIEQFENGPMSESSIVANILREGIRA